MATNRKTFLERLSAFRERAGRYTVLNPEEKRRDARRTASVFFVFALLCGLLLTFLTPPLCAPDENVHFVNVYAISRGDLFANEYEGKMVRWIPTYYNEYVNKYPVSLNLIGNPNRYQYPETYRDSWESFTAVNETPVPFETSITSTGYIISAPSMVIGTALGRLFGRPAEVEYPYNQILFGRIGNILFYCTVIYFAIRRAPHFNKLIMLIALIPMSLFLGASLSYDAVLIPVSLYFISMIMDLCTDPESRLSGSDIVRVMLCVVLLAGMKFGAYLPLLALLLTIPRKKYGTALRMILCIVGVIAAAVIGYLPTIILSARESRLLAATNTVSQSTLQKEYLLSHLSSVPGLIVSAFNMRSGVYFTSFWGELGWLDTFFPLPIMILGYLILGIVGLSECGTSHIWAGKRWKNLFALVAALVGMVGVMLGMYLYFTEVGLPWIEGVQGRYFIPLVLAFALALSNPLCLYFSEGKQRGMERFFNRVTWLWGGGCAVMTVLIVFVRYWIR